MPDGIEARRMKIYVDLFYRNIEGFLAGAFPVMKKICLDASWTGTPWHDLVRQFVHRHPSESPYFLEISQEFLDFMSRHELTASLPWLLELMHYEWVEMALSVSDEPWPETHVDREGDLLGELEVSPLIWPLSYRYAVQNIGPGRLPERIPSEPTWLIVYRRPDDSVHFMESSATTHRLLELLREGSTGADAITKLAAERGLNPDTLRGKALDALSSLRNLHIILGTKID